MQKRLSIRIPIFLFIRYARGVYLTSRLHLTVNLQDADKGHVQMRDLPLEIVDLRS
jgi:hypothetical protein